MRVSFFHFKFHAVLELVLLSRHTSIFSLADHGHDPLLPDYMLGGLPQPITVPSARARVTVACKPGSGSIGATGRTCRSQSSSSASHSASNKLAPKVGVCSSRPIISRPAAGRRKKSHCPPQCPLPWLPPQPEKEEVRMAGFQRRNHSF